MADYDAIVIGSGAGGLTTALSLAQAGEKVLVLEQHYVPGGWCHSFMLGGYRFSPGVHYIGELGPGGRMRGIYEGLGVAGDMTFLELNPDGYDHILIGDERFDIPKGKAAYAERLKSRFPREAKGIDGYLNTVDRMYKELDSIADAKGLLGLLSVPFRAPNVARYSFLTLDRFLDKFTRDPLLRAILSMQSGDHGMPPSLAPAPLHAAVAAHYFDGGYYPKGGGYTIPRAFVRALKRAGGELRLSTAVERILLEGPHGSRRAVGVKLADGTEVSARRVISNADPDMTFRRLVGVENLSPRLRKRLERTRYSISAISLFLAVDMDLRARGYDSGNYWYSRSTDVEHAYQMGFAFDGTEFEDLPGLFLTVTTLKDPSKERRGHHTLEAFSFVSFEAFQKWATTKFGERPEDYKALKAELTRRMLRAADRIVPGLSDHVVFCDLGTPLSNEYYVGATKGNLYGTEKSRKQIGPFAYPLQTEVSGLHMCGASTLGHGVTGATLSGLALAAALLKCRKEELLRHRGAELAVFPCDRVAAWPEELRRPTAEARPQIEEAVL